MLDDDVAKSTILPGDPLLELVFVLVLFQ